MAKIADGIAPASIRPLFTDAIPLNIKSPSPPAPIRAAKVATPMVITVAVLIPAIIIERDRGISIIYNI